ncbi:Sensory box histidine kinase [Labilithrix luteola]|uniref:histidine kinase n=1 Tax=Labilithrix luteola TaxID=1391654 RepID=A0A0K1Q4K3_9BACT|nr:HAMP domain-containing sensor histidine kinase [Labilithrix luteola]AKV00674.1 Sensory box histidine kinase [Labilithrix luteola]
MRRLTQRIARSAERANEIIKALLDLAQTDRGKGATLQREPTDLVDVVKELIQEQESVASGRTFALEVSGDTRAVVDSARIGQVLSNLLGNAVHHSEPRSEIRVRVNGRDDAVELAVENEAEPIPQERIERMFAPFSTSTPVPSCRRAVGTSASGSTS